MSLSRRDVIIGGPSLLAGMLTGSLVASGSEPTPYGSGGFRFAHLSDPHVAPGKIAESGFARALEKAQELGAQFIINGGDAIFEAAQGDRAAALPQWDAFHRVIKQSCSVEVIHVVGNHDIYGWSTEARQPAAKSFTLEQLGLERGYYSLEQGGWKILVLDSIAWETSRTRGYAARLDEEQFVWLEQELCSADSPCCVVSHVPILSACAFFDGPNEQSGQWRLPEQWMHLDARRLKTLFHRHNQVKLCLSGHIHLVDRVEYLGVTYACNGAVCGNYWRGPLQEIPAAFALVDLYPDGRFAHTLVTL